jgi:WbqC-like protein family
MNVIDKTDNYIFSTAYLPPISYFKHILNAKNVFIEDDENYQRQSYRNRCCIYSPNGKQSLSIPVKAGNLTNIKDVKIDYSSHHWQKQHWRSITTAYSNSAYFLHFNEVFHNVYHTKKHKYLLDFNIETLNTILNIVNANTIINKTSSFHKSYTNAKDLRYNIHPKLESTTKLNTYFQTFGEKFGFKDDLSIIDLIFNLGKHSLELI